MPAARSQLEHGEGAAVELLYPKVTRRRGDCVSAEVYADLLADNILRARILRIGCIGEKELHFYVYGGACSTCEV